MSVFSGFREFIARGNAIDLAVGVVIGGAFTAIVNAVVDGFVNPLIAAIFQAPDLSQMWVLHVGSSALRFGLILDAIIKFLIIAAAIYFVIIVPVNKLSATFRKKKEDEPEPSAEEKLLTEIRDLMRQDPGRAWPYS